MTDIPVSRRRGRLVWGALALSLAVNGFFAGMFAMSWTEGPRRGGGPLRTEITMVDRHLPEAERAALKEGMRALLPELRPRWRRLRELRHEIGVEAAKPAPDRAAIDARLETIRGLTTETQTLVQKRLFDQVLALPAEARAELGTSPEERR